MATQLPDHKVRKRWKLTPRFWGFLFAIFFAYMAIAYATSFSQIWRLKSEIQHIEEQIARVEARNQELREELEYLQSEEYIERVARQELGLVKPGETAVFVASPAGDGSSEREE